MIYDYILGIKLLYSSEQLCSEIRGDTSLLVMQIYYEKKNSNEINFAFQKTYLSL